MSGLLTVGSLVILSMICWRRLVGSSVAGSARHHPDTRLDLGSFGADEGLGARLP
jgi:hypothetical protein